ncbi:MAG: hypothetical protein V7636_2884 [Actinomycetota bacterium]|jgi:hypothetical protein
MELRERVEAIVGQRVVALDEIPGTGGYTPALRRVATLNWRGSACAFRGCADCSGCD